MGTKILLGAQEILFGVLAQANQDAAATTSVPSLQQEKMQLLVWLRCLRELSSVAFEGGIGCL